MNRVTTQSLFHSATTERPSWRSYATSGVIHALVIALALAIYVPAIQKLDNPRAPRVVLLAPDLPAFRPKVIPPRPIQPPKITKVEIPRKPQIRPPVVKPPEVKPQIIASAPVIKEIPTPVRPLPETKVDIPAPKPEIHTGTFENTERAKGPTPTPKQLKVGGFGDPRGVPASQTSPQSSLVMAKVGSFDLPNGEGKGGGGGRSQNGGIREGAFGSVGNPGSSSGSTGQQGTVRTGGFGDSSTTAPATVQRARAVEPATTQVEILFKPKPVYTQEARNLKLEGQVSLDVVFLASGTVRVIRVVHGLGHGLDEAAQQAATQVRFKPATRGGVPVDMNATIYITFELA